MNEATGPGPTLTALRQRAPVVHSVTSLVAMDVAASLLLAIGALPAIAHDEPEAPDMVAEADALTVNAGALSADQVEPMAAAARRAVELGKPWVLDPAGGEAARRLARLQPTVIRGNGSEIMALAQDRSPARGAGPRIDSTEALDAAYDLARATGAVVAVTGAVDYVIDGKAIVAVANGDPMMARVTALGCALTCLIGACCAVNRDAMAATVHGLAVMGLSAELAAARAEGPGSFRTHLIDRLYNLDPAALARGARIQ
jgi:hydroxyethylthiazole kinase